MDLRTAVDMIANGYSVRDASDLAGVPYPVLLDRVQGVTRQSARGAPQRTRQSPRAKHRRPSVDG